MIEQKTLDGDSIIVGAFYKVLRLSDNGEKLLSYFDHDEWTIEYPPGVWVIAPNGSLIYGFDNPSSAELNMQNHSLTMSFDPCFFGEISIFQDSTIHILHIDKRVEVEKTKPNIIGAVQIKLKKRILEIGE